MGSGASPVLACDLELSAGALNLEIKFTLQGRQTFLWGASGAGKSTLLRMLAGLAQPSAGSLTLAGRTLLSTAKGICLPAGERGIGLLSQDPALFPHLSVRENIAFGLRGLERREQNARVDELLALFVLRDLADRRPATLSGGESRRVALARALAPRPRLLLLDEAFTALDAVRREETRASLETTLQAQETAVLAVTHDLAEVFAPTLFGPAEVLVLQAGRIAAQGPPGQVLAAERAALLRQLGASPQ